MSNFFNAVGFSSAVGRSEPSKSNKASSNAKTGENCCDIARLKIRCYDLDNGTNAAVVTRWIQSNMSDAKSIFLTYENLAFSLPLLATVAVYVRAQCVVDYGFVSSLCFAWLIHSLLLYFNFSALL
jgi:hypothetical protein